MKRKNKEIHFETVLGEETVNIEVAVGDLADLIISILDGTDEEVQHPSESVGKTIGDRGPIPGSGFSRRAVPYSDSETDTTIP